MKKLLILLFSLLFGFISFGHCIEIYDYTTFSVPAGGNVEFYKGQCFRLNAPGCMGNLSISENGVITSVDDINTLYCFNQHGYVYSNHNLGCSLTVVYLTGFDMFCQSCSEVDTGAILSGNCDTNYCVENDLCPVPSNFSQLFINDLEFPGKPLINVNIPDYIQWDYSSSDTGFDLYVGSGYDQDYINSIIDINSYRPDSSDFTNIFVSGMTLIFPYLIFALFIVFMRKLIKRIFKH